MSDIAKGLNDTLKLNDIGLISQNISEVLLDQLMKDGIAKEIPIVRTVVGLANASINIKDHIFLKKVAKFLFELNETTIDERIEFIDKIENSEEYANNVGEAIILILDKLDDLEKPKILGKLLKSVIKGKIDYQTFLRLSFCIENIFYLDIEELKNLKQGKDISYDTKNSLYNAGLMKRTPLQDLMVGGGNELLISELGDLLILEIYNI